MLLTDIVWSLRSSTCNWNPRPGPSARAVSISNYMSFQPAANCVPLPYKNRPQSIGPCMFNI